jgi:hypothetical protein
MNREKLAGELVKMAKKLTAGGPVAYVVHSNEKSISILVREVEHGRIDPRDVMSTIKDLTSRIMYVVKKLGYRMRGQIFAGSLNDGIYSGNGSEMYLQVSVRYDRLDDMLIDEMVENLESMGVKEWRKI